MTTIEAQTGPVLAGFVNAWNATLPVVDRKRLAPQLSLAATGVTPGVERTRWWIVYDWLVRASTAGWLEHAGLRRDAQALGSLPVLDSASSASVVGSVLTQARASAASAWGATRNNAFAARGPFVGMAYGAAAGAALRNTVGAVRTALTPAELDAALDVMRGAVLAAGRVSAHGMIPPAVLGHAYDTAVDASYDAAQEAVDAAGTTAAQAAWRALADNPFSPAPAAIAFDTALDAAANIGLNAAFGAAYGAAYEGAYEAPRAAVRAASLGAARAALDTAIRAIQDSAIDTLTRMINAADVNSGPGNGELA